MVYDCIPFFNELDILNLRLHILDPYVDRFVIEEATVTFSGEKKELVFEKNREMFAEFLPKITHIVVDDTPADAADTYVRDYYQKNRLIEGLKDASEEDVILFGDADEIPDPKTLQKLIGGFDREKVYHLAQRNFYVYLNNEEKSGKLLSITGEFPDIPEEKRLWLGTKVCSVKNIPEEGIVRLRDLVPVTDERSVRVENGGWHFGYMGGHGEKDPSIRIGVKTKAAAHQDYNEKEVLKETMDHLYLGRDIFGRDASFMRVDVDETYPEYLLEHKEEFAHLILPEISVWKKLRSRMNLTAGRFFRKVKRRLTRLMNSNNRKVV
ncbi:MAG: glycosyl transferase GT17 family protein [Lachnospiraceae bacterium]|nr:glycosyl transferase GT17 family protein [Lachnospiraceae bacterium]